MRLKLIELQGEMDKLTIIVGDFNIPLSEMTRSASRKSIKIELILTASSRDYFIQNQKSTHSSQVHMEHSPR